MGLTRVSEDSDTGFSSEEVRGVRDRGREEAGEEAERRLSAVARGG